MKCNMINYKAMYEEIKKKPIVLMFLKGGYMNYMKNQLDNIIYVKNITNNSQNNFSLRTNQTREPTNYKWIISRVG